MHATVGDDVPEECQPPVPARDPYPVPMRDGGRRISPTMVSQFIRLDQCRRFLRLALHGRNVSQRFLYAYDVAPQEISPLLTRAGAEFEERVEEQAGRRFSTRNLAREHAGGDRKSDNQILLETVTSLQPGDVAILFQVRLQVQVDGWNMVGDADIVRLERSDTGDLALLIADMKSTTTAKIEHRLQVAFYREMVERLFQNHDLSFAEIATGILYRGAPEARDINDEAEAARLEAERAAARAYFHVEDAFLELTPDADAYLDAARDLVTGRDSVASEVIETPFDDIPWHLAPKCDGCIYSEFCMKWAAEHDDLSLLPHLTQQEKQGLLRAGVRTTREVAALMEPVVDPETGQQDLRKLRVAPGKTGESEQIARTWPVGPRMEELVHRARRYRAWQKDEISALSYIPSKGYGSLPYSAEDHNPNLVRVFVDAQFDYLRDRLYLIGSLVVASVDGVPDPMRRRSVVEMTAGMPTEESERNLLLQWVEGTIRAIAELAAPDAAGEARAPIHLIFFSGLEQKALLQALSRHASEVLAATPLYDFMTQIAAFDSPIATFLDREIRELKNYPVLCQSLQAVASMTWVDGERFDWNEDAPYRELFRERMFDALGRYQEPDPDADVPAPWSTRRSRFNSQIPLEFAYAAWLELAEPPAAGRDPFAPFRAVTPLDLRGFQVRRLEAMEHVANDFRGNKETTKTPFALPDLATFQGKAQGLAEALQEFVTIERHVELAAWKSARLPSPERRVLSGDTLIVKYLVADQLPGVAETYAENQRLAAKKKALLASLPEGTRLTKEQNAEFKPEEIPGPFRLRLDVHGAGISLDDALGLTTIKAEERVRIEPRWTFDTRLPESERVPLTSTPKQLLYGMGQHIVDIETELDADGRVQRAWLRTVPTFTMKSDNPPGFLFPGFDEELIDGELYTVDSDPNDINGFWQAKIVQGLVAGQRNTLFDRVESKGVGDVAWPPAASEGQARFLAGLTAMHEAGVGTSFEPSKEAYIGAHGGDPMVLVQGPPGTGKSFTTAYAILARMQGALAANIPLRVLIGAKTHAATNVLLESVVDAVGRLRDMREQQPDRFTSYFDKRLLDVPLFRLQPKDTLPASVSPLFAGAMKPKEQARAWDIVGAESIAVVAATPGAVYSADGDSKAKHFGNEIFQLLVLDEASQLSLPESIVASLPLHREAQIVVVGDHRQMAPIVKHDWENETRRTFQEFAVYRSLFETVKACNPVDIRFERSFRLDRDMAEFLRQGIYRRDGLQYHSQRRGSLRFNGHDDEFVQAALDPRYPLVVIVHNEASSQLRNDFERTLTLPLLQALRDAGYDVADGYGMVVPHRAQRANLQDALRGLLAGSDEDLDEIARAVDTVERFQGGERHAIIVSATESDPAYLLAAGKFFFDPRRLTVAMSRAKDKMVLVASRSAFELFSPDEETFLNAQLWKDLLKNACTIPLWRGEKEGYDVEVWGNSELTPTGEPVPIQALDRSG